MSYFGEPTARIAAMKETLLNITPQVCVERAVYTTQAYKEHRDKPSILKRAYAIRNTLENMTIFLEDGTLLAGGGKVLVSLPRDFKGTSYTVPDGVEIFAINGPLFFGVADRFQSTLDAMETPPKVFIMYLHNTPAIDMTGIHALEAFLERRQEGCRVLFAAVQEPARRTLQRVGILRAVGEENIYPSLDEALLRAEEILEEEKRK